LAEVNGETIDARMRDHAVEELARPTRTSPVSPLATRTLRPVELARWIEAHTEILADRWVTEIRARETGSGKAIEGFVEPFVRLLVSMIPEAVGPLREQVEPIWIQTAELFGSVASRRGLAAGEVIEEFQLLREGLIRSMFEHPPVDDGARMSLRDILRLNRIVDLGVTHASVGHTDALFFSLFQGSGVPDSPTEQLEAEVAEQLDALREELAEVTGTLEG